MFYAVAGCKVQLLTAKRSIQNLQLSDAAKQLYQQDASDNVKGKAVAFFTGTWYIILFQDDDVIKFGIVHEVEYKAMRKGVLKKVAERHYIAIMFRVVNYDMFEKVMKKVDSVLQELFGQPVPNRSEMYTFRGRKECIERLRKVIDIVWDYGESGSIVGGGDEINPGDEQQAILDGDRDCWSRLHQHSHSKYAIPPGVHNDQIKKVGEHAYVVCQYTTKKGEKFNFARALDKVELEKHVIRKLEYYVERKDNWSKVFYSVAKYIDKKVVNKTNGPGKPCSQIKASVGMFLLDSNSFEGYDEGLEALGFFLDGV